MTKKALFIQSHDKSGRPKNFWVVHANISKQWINDLQYEILRPYGKEQYILVERSELPAEVAFRLDVCPVAGEDVHHCYRTTLD